MIRQELLFIINPRAGSEKNKSYLENAILKELDLQKYTAIFEYTKRKDHATDLVKNYLNKGVRTFIAVGGDGTVNETAKGLIDTDAALFIIPRGSGNGLARHLGLMLSLPASIKKLNQRNCQKIDVGQINQIPFFCTMGYGFDSHCAYIFDKQPSKRGFLNYLKIGLQEWRKYNGVNLKLNGKDYQNLSGITFGNANQFGNNAYITPNASLTDGLLDVSIIEELNTWQAIKLVVALFSKKIDKHTKCEMSTGDNFVLETAQAATIHIDGEPIATNERVFTISILKKALNVIV